MKLIIFSIIILAVLPMLPASGQAQRLGSETTDQLERLDTGVSRIPESPNSAPLHRHKNLLPKSYVPPRSPDLGEPYSPSPRLSDPGRDYSDRKQAGTWRD
jgi:hypothetical protein